MVARPAELGVFAFAGFDGHGGLAGVGGELSVGGVALTAVTDLGEHGGGAQPRVRSDGQRAKRGTGGVRLERVSASKRYPSFTPVQTSFWRDSRPANGTPDFW